MTPSLLGSVVICLVAAPTWVQDAKPNFTGTWVLDVAKSDHQSPAPQSIVLVIDHKDPSIKIATSVKYDTGESTDTLSLTTDGKEVRDTIKAMGTERERKVTAKWDGERLLTSMRFDADGPTAEVSDSWALAENATVLTLVRVINSSQGHFTLKTVYKRE